LVQHSLSVAEVFVIGVEKIREKSAGIGIRDVKWRRRQAGRGRQKGEGSGSKWA